MADPPGSACLARVERRILKLLNSPLLPPPPAGSCPARSRGRGCWSYVWVTWSGRASTLRFRGICISVAPIGRAQLTLSSHYSSPGSILSSD